MKKNRFFKKTDLIVILALATIGLLMGIVHTRLFSGRAARAEIYYYSELVRTIDLVGGKEEFFSIPQNENVVFHIDTDGNISFVKSDCPDKICIKTGKIHIVGQSAACLPNGIVLKIVPLKGRGGDDLDMIAGHVSGG